MYRILVPVLASAGLFAADNAVAQEFPQATSCVAGATTHTYRLSENPDQRVRLNAMFSSQLRESPLLDNAWNELAPVRSNAEWVKVKLEHSSCGAQGEARKDAEVGTMAVGGCHSAGCIGNLPLQFDGEPGDTITITTCGGGVQETGSFEMNGDGQWVMHSYSSVRVTSCTLTPPG